MTKKQILLWLLQIALFTGLAALQFVDQNSGQEGSIHRKLCGFIVSYRLVISLVMGLCFAVLSGWKTLFYPRQRTQEIRETIMETLREELLGGDKNNYRITIFKDAGFFKRLIIYAQLGMSFVGGLVTGRKVKWPKRGRFVYVWRRLGTEHPDSKTFYYYAKQTAKNCQGVAGTVMQSLTDIVVENLPDIEDINLNTVDSSNRHDQDARKVLKYMGRSYIKDFETLKRLHRRPRHIYGNILNNPDGARGVLVIDSFLEQSFLSEDIEGRLGKYAIMIGATM